MFDNRVYDHFKAIPQATVSDVFTREDTVLTGQVRIYTIFTSSLRPVPGIGGTKVAFYVMGTSMPRIGTEDDIDIIQSMIDEKAVVVCVDYGKNPDAVCPKLETSVLTLLEDVIKGHYFKDLDAFPDGDWMEAHVVPAGCRMLLDQVFFSFDKHGPAGLLDKIVNIWNNDFRSVKGNIVIKWTDENGNRKAIQPGHDGTEPEWLDQNGHSDINGSYIRIKHTKATVFKDCVKSDGSPLMMDLKMDIVYPSFPSEKVPVMCLNCANEHLASHTHYVCRPQFTGFLMRGYACVNFEYGYTPMARSDHYDYFDGNNYKESITGRNTTYSIQFFCEAQITTAAIRYVRYLSLADKCFNFDSDAIGVFGFSKGGWMTYLSQSDPEKHPSRLYLSGHHGESMFEAGEPGAEKAPWSEYNGQTINGHVNFVYPSCGGNFDDLMEGNAPVYISCNLQDGSAYGMSTDCASLCRSHQIPTIVAVCDVEHTYASGPETRYGYDTYQAFFDFAGTVLKGEKPCVLYRTKDALGNPVTGFTGVVTADEADACFREKERHLVPSYGGTVWTNVINEKPAPKRTETECIRISSLPFEPYVRTAETDDGIRLTVSENIDINGKTQYVNESFYTNPTAAFFLKVPCLGASGIRASLKVRDSVRRRIRPAFQYPREEVRRLHLDQNTRNFRSAPGEWTEISLYQEIISDNEYFIFSLRLDSTGNTEMPILLSDLTIEREYI